jgi:hypothetical protein
VIDPVDRLIEVDSDDDDFEGGAIIKFALIEITASLNVDASLDFKSERTLDPKASVEDLRKAPRAEALPTLSVVIFVVTSRFALASRLAV